MFLKKAKDSILKPLNRDAAGNFYRRPSSRNPLEIGLRPCTPKTKLVIRDFKENVLDYGPQHYSFHRIRDTDEHINALKKEFSGKSYLEFFHAATITFIRRRLNLRHCLSNFKKIWNKESEFMCSRLDSRWLVSACDTIIDHFKEKDEVATALAGTLFMNTIKLYETERLVQQKVREFDEIFQTVDRVPLFDGMSAYIVGYEDGMFRKLVIRTLTHSNSRIASPILKELIKRANTHDTVFKRLDDQHDKKINALIKHLLP